jgi:hypothetical protein
MRIYVNLFEFIWIVWLSGSAAVCGSALGTVWQRAQQCSSVSQCAAVCAAVCGCAVVCGCAAVCGSALGSEWQCVRLCAAAVCVRL